MEERRDDNFIWPLQTRLHHSCPLMQHLRSYAESGRSHQGFSLGPVAFTGWVSSKGRKCIVGLDLSAHAFSPSLGRYTCGRGQRGVSRMQGHSWLQSSDTYWESITIPALKKFPSRRYEQPAFRVHLPTAPWDFLHRISAC